MSQSSTYSESSTFTITHARHMAAKVAADLKRMQRFYDSPSDAWIADFESEAIELIKAGYLGAVTYGFQRSGNWIEPTLRYTARELIGASANDDDPGRIRPGASIIGARFTSYLNYSTAWYRLTTAEQQAFEATLPFSRNGTPEPGVTGVLTNDRTYSSGGRAIDRACVQRLS